MKILLLTLFISTLIHATIKDKTSNDVYAIAETLKIKVMHLAGEKNIDANYMKLVKQTNKSPRQVLQKTLEVLKKINKYRENNNLGLVNVPTYPSKIIQAEDVYYSVVRLNNELDLLLKHVNCTHIKSLSVVKKYIDKTSNEMYHEIWLASLAMDELLGKGFSPTDNYKESVLILDIVNFIRNSQGIYDEVSIPKKRKRKHPNHVLYATNKLLTKIAKVETKLWMEPVSVAENPQRVITPTEVYDSMQMVITELKRIRRRLGTERLYDVKEIYESKTPSDVLQNIEYAIKLFPAFNVSDDLVQYSSKSLNKTINELYSLSQFIFQKTKYLKEIKGIKVELKEPPMIYSLNKMHIYQKGIETMEKINKLRIKEKLYEVSVPSSPVKKKSTDAVYELLLMIDDEISIIMQRNGIKNILRWSYSIDKKLYKNKTPSDIYHNLWKISSTIDIFRGIEHSPMETYKLAKKMEQRIENIIQYLIKDNKNKIVLIEHNDKRPSDVFQLIIKLYETLAIIEKRANIPFAGVEIPMEKTVTSDTVYNALRVVNATLIDINIHFGIESKIDKVAINSNETSTDVYDLVFKSYNNLQLLLKDDSYEN